MPLRLLRTSKARHFKQGGDEGLIGLAEPLPSPATPLDSLDSSQKTPPSESVVTPLAIRHRLQFLLSQHRNEASTETTNTNPTRPKDLGAIHNMPPIFGNEPTSNENLLTPCPQHLRAPKRSRQHHEC
jgi:hypothetical protein